MSTSPEPEPGIPTFEELAADPEIAALLDFEPVPRKVRRPDGWTDRLQREFIARLAWLGSPGKAADQMGKNVSGVEGVFKSAGGASFRAAWARALEIGRARIARSAIPTLPGRPPGIGRGRLADPEPTDAEWEPVQDDDPEMDLDEKLKLIQRLAVKFLKKVVAEREARLAGEVVAADFYLRQVTALEVIFDLLTDGAGGMDAWEAIKVVQRGGHNWQQIVDTPFARLLDDKRCEYWAASSQSVLGTDEQTSGDEPMRPVAFAQEFLLDHGDHRTAVDQNAYGASTTPARGYSAEQWAAMDYDEQRAARRGQFDADAEAQVEWEPRAHQAWEASEHGARARAEFEQSKNHSS